jgi:S-adenosylmethionine:tRNA ribosyltransferase-isomerase
MKTSFFDYTLPKGLIANSPARPRDHSRLMIIDRKTGKIRHHKFYEIEKILGPSDVLVLNKTKVFPARFIGKKDTGGGIEILLIKELNNRIWKCLTKPGLKIGQTATFQGATLKGVGRDGTTSLIEINLGREKLFGLLQKYGLTPLPPYVRPESSERDLRKQYQTVYAKSLGSIAAPTAGFHFTEKLLGKLKKKGVQIEYVTLHVGLGTFAPVKTATLEEHQMHEEEFHIDKKTLNRLNIAKKSGKRIVAVGTTSARVLETLAINNLKLKINNSGSTNLFIFPPYKYSLVDALITNFHLPKSTLLALVSAFVSSPNTRAEFKDFKSSLIGRAYFEAIRKKYRFYSFGDACLIV